MFIPVHLIVLFLLVLFYVSFLFIAKCNECTQADDRNTNLSEQLQRTLENLNHISSRNSYHENQIKELLKEALRSNEIIKQLQLKSRSIRNRNKKR